MQVDDVQRFKKNCTGLVAQVGDVSCCLLRLTINNWLCTGRLSIQVLTWNQPFNLAWAILHRLITKESFLFGIFQYLDL